MKTIYSIQRFGAVVSALFLAAVPGWNTEAQEDRKIGAGKAGDRVACRSELSPEDQKKLREALRTVWSDPKVLSARENVNRSAREYQDAIRETIANQDPETAKLLEKLHRSKTGMHPKGGGMDGTKRPHSLISNGRGLDQMLAPPSMMEKMDSAQKQRFAEVGKKAKEQKEVVAALRGLAALHKEDEAIRKRKFEAVRKFRRSYFEAVARIDPELKQFIPPPRSDSPRPFGEKGKSIMKRPGGKSRPEQGPSSRPPDKRPERSPVQSGDDKVQKDEDKGGN